MPALTRAVLAVLQKDRPSTVLVAPPWFKRPNSLASGWVRAEKEGFVHVRGHLCLLCYRAPYVAGQFATWIGSGFPAFPSPVRVPRG